MKEGARAIGFDDGPFTFDDARVPVVGVVMRGATYVEAVLTAEVDVDGVDATSALTDLLAASRHTSALHLVFLDGASVGGFNIIDMDALHAATGLPVVSVTAGAPDRTKVEETLVKHFPDWEARLATLDAQWPRPFPTAGKDLHVASVGLSRAEVADALARFTVHGLTPEPIRVAHLIATALAEGESRGQS